MPMLQAVNAAALMERTHFAIDDAKDEDEDDDDDEDLRDNDHDDQVMDEVRPFHLCWHVECRYSCAPLRLTRSSRRTIQD